MELPFRDGKVWDEAAVVPLHSRELRYRFEEIRPEVSRLPAAGVLRVAEVSRARHVGRGGGLLAKLVSILPCEGSYDAAVRIMLDEARDRAYIQMKDVWEASPDGSSIPLLPPGVPDRVDVYWDGEERICMFSVDRASKRLHPDALKQAVPFEPSPPMPPGWQHWQPPDDGEAKAIRRNTAASEAALERMLAGGYASGDPTACRKALAAAEAEAAEAGVGFGVIGPSEFQDPGFVDFFVAMVSGDRRGVIRAGVRSRSSDTAERRAELASQLLAHLRAEPEKLAPYDTFDVMVMTVGPIWFTTRNP